MTISKVSKINNQKTKYIKYVNCSQNRRNFNLNLLIVWEKVKRIIFLFTFHYVFSVFFFFFSNVFCSNDDQTRNVHINSHTHTHTQLHTVNKFLTFGFRSQLRSLFSGAFQQEMYFPMCIRWTISSTRCSTALLLSFKRFHQ